MEEEEETEEAEEEKEEEEKEEDKLRKRSCRVLKDSLHTHPPPILYVLKDAASL